MPPEEHELNLGLSRFRVHNPDYSFYGLWIYYNLLFLLPKLQVLVMYLRFRLVLSVLPVVLSAHPISVSFSADGSQPGGSHREIAVQIF